MWCYPTIILLVGALSACSTAQVQTSCQETQEFFVRYQDVLDALPLEARALVSAARTGAVVCGSDQYAAARDIAIAWVRERAGR